jgi:trk system potassium uptake protein TrkH
MSPGRFIVLGFAFVILLGAILLLLPISHNEGVDVSAIDALFTSTSAVCVTGLITVETAETYNVFGRIIIALLIQIGGLGVASVGVSFLLLTKGKVSFKDRLLLKEALNLNSMKGIVKLVKVILFITLCFEGTGVILSYIVFAQDYPPLQALGISLFHSVSSFNNAGFDVLGGFKSLIDYKSNVLLNLTTCGLIIFGGLGFYCIQEIVLKKSFRKFSLHTKVVISMTISLLVSGTLLIKLTEDVSWLGAFFFSTSARTAGFATYNVGEFTQSGLFVLILLMFVGASPGSTGGGVKTTTAFALVKSSYSLATNRQCASFKRRIPVEIIHRAFILVFLAAALICTSTFIISILEPEYSFIQLLFEVVSGFGTVGLSTGITPSLSTVSKIILILNMFVGRLGPLTMVTIWSFREASNISYSEETITIG